MDTRECPACHAQIDYQRLIDDATFATVCDMCGAKLQLRMEEVETPDTVEYLTWFEVQTE